MSDLRICRASLSSLRGAVRLVVNGKDAYGRHAIEVGDRLHCSFVLPRILGAHGGTFSITADGSWHAEELPLSFAGQEGASDVFSVLLDSGALRLSAGLYFCRLYLQTAYGEVCAYGGNTFCFAPLAEDVPSVFQLTVSQYAHKEPDWLYGGVIYHVFVDRFFRGGNAPAAKGSFIDPDWENGIPQYPPYPGAPLANNKFFGGDLDGVRLKLPYIASLGARAIYLSPIFRAASNHKYDTGDYGEVDAAFGGLPALRALIAEAKKYGIRIILDGVFNHTGADSLYFNRYGNYESVGAFQSKESPYADWYTFSAFPHRYDAWWGIEILPRLNLKNEECRAYLVGREGIVARYAAEGIGGMRLDVADELDGDFIAEVKKRLCEKDASAVLYGEVWEDASNKIAYGRRCTYYLGDQLDGVMNYPLRTGVLRYVREKDSAALAYYFGEVLPNMPKRAADTAMNFLGTHDTLRALTALGGASPEGKSNDELALLRMTPEEREKALRMLKAAYLIVATVPGIPTVYYGDEVGMEGYSDPFNRMPFPWHNICEDLLSHYRKMAEIRQNAVYRDGEFRLLHLSRDLLAFLREKDGVRAVTLYHNGEGTVTVRLPKGTEVLTDASVSDDRLALTSGEGAVLLLPQNGDILIENTAL